MQGSGITSRRTEQLYEHGFHGLSCCVQAGILIEDLLKLPVIKKLILYHILPALEEFAEIAVGEVIQSLLAKEGIKASP